MAQSVQDTLFVVPGKKNLYFYHVVNKGESLYGIARNYRLEPKELADANQITSNTPLKLFQLLKIPLTTNNLVQSANTAVSAMTPLYHKVIKGETLYHISRMHDQVDTSLLKRWNHLRGNDLKIGQYLVVGWLNTANANPGQIEATAKADKPAVEKTVANKPSITETPTPTPEEEDARNQSAGKQVAANDQDNGFLSEVIASENQSRNHAGRQKPAAAGTKPAISGNADDEDAFTVIDKPASTKNTVPKAQPAPEEDPKMAAVKPAAEIKPKVEKPVKKEDSAKDNAFAKMLDEVTHKPQSTGNSRPVVVSKPQAQDDALPSPANVSQGNTDANATTTMNGNLTDSVQLTTSTKSEFEMQFDQQTDNGEHVEVKKGAAGWFRSNVKAGSGRYYALCNDLPRGTIVKVINPITGKYVLTKVLDAIPQQKGNYNLIIKLSDAAMEDLGVVQSRFWCEIQYAASKDSGK